MTIIACLVLILSVLTLMTAYAAGPFANDPWYRIHVRFTQLNLNIQLVLKVSALLLCIICSLQIIGVFA